MTHSTRALVALLALTAPALAAPPAGPTATDAAAQPLVRPLGPDTYALDRAQVRALFVDPSPIRRQGWITPHIRPTTGGGLEASDVIGLELHGIDKGSDVDRAGLRTGDVVTHLDGTSIGSIPIAMGVGLRLRARIEAGETTTTLVLLRAGRRLTRTWHVVDAPGATSKPAAAAPSTDPPAPAPTPAAPTPTPAPTPAPTPTPHPRGPR